jgi:hypothetical protein
MTDRKPFMLRLEPATMEALKMWAADDLRSVNGQIEYLLRVALRGAGRLPGSKKPRPATDAEPDSSEPPGEQGPEQRRSDADRQRAAAVGTRR